MNCLKQLSRLFAIAPLILVSVLFIDHAFSAEAQEDWKKIIEAAKKEGKVVAGGPPTASRSSVALCAPRRS